MNREVNCTKRIKTPQGLRYCPVILSANGRIRPDWVLVNGKEERHPEGDGLIAQRLRDEFLKQGFLAWSDISYRHGVEGDCDVVALHGEYLFIFECKNSLHPCSAAELRTSFDYLVKARTRG